MVAPHPEIVIVRRRSAHEEGHHGGAWKIAFADFMTAMMAFFLVLWIISATDKNTKTLIARYFNPVKVEEPAKARKGIRGVAEKDADSLGEDSSAPNAGGKPNAGRGEGASASTGEASPPNRPNENDQKGPPDPAKPAPTMSEQELFSDPRASLDKIGAATSAGPLANPPAGPQGFGDVGPSAADGLRDPFRPLGSDRAANVATSDPGAPAAPGAAADKPQPSVAPDAAISRGPETKETSRRRRPTPHKRGRRRKRRRRRPPLTPRRGRPCRPRRRRPSPPRPTPPRREPRRPPACSPM